MAFSSRVFSPNVITLPSDPILAALARHREAWACLANAAPDDAADAAKAQVIALAVVIVTPCTTQVGAEALLRHLRACLAANGSTLALPPETVEVLTVRAADLTRLLGYPHTYAPISLGEAAAAVIRSLNRFGEVAAALAIVAGGVVLTGLASLL